MKIAEIRKRLSATLCLLIANAWQSRKFPHDVKQSQYSVRQVESGNKARRVCVTDSYSQKFSY
jgi:hypothetical protein